MTDPWVRQQPDFLRTIKIHSQSDLNSWLANPMNNDLVEWYEDAGELGGHVNVFKDNVVIRGEGHARHSGMISLQGKNFWLIDMHVKNLTDSCVNMYWQDDAVVNCVLEGNGVTPDSVCLFVGAGGGSNKLVYGNILRNKEHGLYIQNTNTSGRDWVVHNYIGDVVPNSGGRSLHEYSQQPNKNEACSYLQNVFANGQVLIGGESNATIPLWNVFQSCWFSFADVSLGYKRPQASDLLDCFLVYSVLDEQRFQGDGDDNPNPDYSQILRNTLFNPNGYTHKLGTSAYVGGVRQDGTPALRAGEQWNNNTYHGFKASDFHNGVKTDPITDIQVWRTKTGYDTSSVVLSTPPSARYWVIPNDYNPKKGMLVTWGVNYIPFTNTGTKIYSVSDPYGAPIPGPTVGQELMLNAYVIKYK